MKIEKAIYSAYATASGGREGRASTPDKRLDVTLSTPKELGGDGGAGTNPEQLFAAGYSACFLGALKFVAAEDKLSITDTAKVSARVGIGSLDHGFGIDVDLDISLPGLDKAKAEELVARAHQVCPYSNATRGNIDVSLSVNNT